MTEHVTTVRGRLTAEQWARLYVLDKGLKAAKIVVEDGGKQRVFVAEKKVVIELTEVTQ